MVYIFTIQNMSMSNLQSCCSTLLLLCCTSRIFWSSLVRQHHFQKEVLSVPWYHTCATMTRCKQLKWETQHHKSWPTDSRNLASEPHIKNTCHLGSSFQIWWEVKRVWSNPLINHHSPNETAHRGLPQFQTEPNIIFLLCCWLYPITNPSICIYRLYINV